MRRIERTTRVAIENDHLVLARGHVEMVITPNHLSMLKTLTDKKEFVDYFEQKALVNRSARNTFRSWLRKEHSTLWQDIYRVVHQNS